MKRPSLLSQEGVTDSRCSRGVLSAYIEKAAKSAPTSPDDARCRWVQHISAPGLSCACGLCRVRPPPTYKLK
jgi:hypothetical protein